MSKKIKKIVLRQAQHNPERSRRIVCFGGGNVVPRLLLEPLKRYPVKLTGVTSMVDNGGSAGQLREDFGILPPGDIRRHFIALSDAPQWKKDLFKFRFGREKFPGGHKGHNFANVFIGGLEYILKDYRKVLKVVHDFMELKKQYRALPATIDKVHVVAELENGRTIKGEDEIDVPQKHNPKLKIKKVYLKPKGKVFPPTKKAVVEANLITLGPGDLYSSTIPCLLSEGMKRAFKKSKAKKVFICNVMTKLGETNNFSVSDFTKEIEKYLGCPLNFVIYNTEIPNKKRIKDYKKEEPLILDLVKIDPSIKSGKARKKFIGKNLLTKSGPVIHDSKKVVKILLKLCRR
jgi:uncharacterized cofD-like protein